LHVVKSSDGAAWAAWQVCELIRLGVEVHVVLPSENGRMMPEWRRSGATLHFADLDFPSRSPWRLASLCGRVRQLIDETAPDVVHTHHVGPTLVIRRAMKNSGPIRIFQVPGPLHLEHAFYRKWELSSAAGRDCWIGASRYIVSLYRKAGIDQTRLFTSYNGTRPEAFRLARSGALRQRLGIPRDRWVVGNINYIYPPKYHLAQFVGLKAHEDLIDALALVTQRRPGVTGVLIGGQWGGASGYERKLRKRACAVGRGRIHMPGYFSPADVQRCWPDFDCAIHAPLSENCGGVVEPLLAGVPTIAGRIGGLPEVVIDGLTGRTVPIRNPEALASAIEATMDSEPESRRMAEAGQRLVQAMFDIRRTSLEVLAVYRHLLNPSCPRPEEFDSFAFARAVSRSR
jgi:glycosyltransferase involved in cell wall biosynthesis